MEYSQLGQRRRSLYFNYYSEIVLLGILKVVCFFLHKYGEVTICLLETVFP